jgi:ACS family glucarate transporter-like MFS transporter
VGADQQELDSQAPATRVRHEVLTLTTLMAVLLYLDRVCISMAAPAIGADLCLDKSQFSLVFSAFFFAYALAQVPGGWLGDRWGARGTLTVCVLAWSAFTAATGLAGGLAMLLAARFLFGLAQAGAYPIAARVNSLWIPFNRRGLASSIITLGGRAGGALALPATAYLMVLFAGWRPVFWYYGLLGVGWAVVFWGSFRNRPGLHPACNAAEVRLIEGGLPAQATSPHTSARDFPWKAACRSLGMWMQCLTQFTTNVAWVFLVTWMPTYFLEAYGLDEEETGLLTGIPLLAGMAGCLLGGLATDRLTRRWGLKWGRSLLGMVTKFVAAVGLVGAVLADDPYLATAGLALASFAVDTGLGATWAYFQDAGGPYVGTLLGWANMFGNLGAVVSPHLLSWLADSYSWSTSLAVCAGIYIASGLCWFGVDARVPIVSPLPDQRSAPGH